MCAVKMKMEEERHEEEGETKLFKFEFFVLLFFSLGPSGFGLCNFVTRHLKRHIIVIYHVTHRHIILCLPHTNFCNRR